MTHALGAKERINLVYELAHVDRIVWASRLTNIAVDALIGDDQRQLRPSPKFTFKLCLNHFRHKLSHVAA